MTKARWCIIKPVFINTKLSAKAGSFFIGTPVSQNTKNNRFDLCYISWQLISYPAPTMSVLFGKLHRRLLKLAFYAQHFHLGIAPKAWLARDAGSILAEFNRLPAHQQQAVRRRVDYYNRLSTPQTGISLQESVGAYRRRPGWNSSYFYDLAALLRYFPSDYAFNCEFGDITHIPEQPAFVKSRPISGHNQHSVVLKLDSVRHFYIPRDPHPAGSKIHRAVWRGAAHQAWRQQFLRQFHDHPFCDIGCVHSSSRDTPYHRQYMTIAQQLRYRYIISLEGNDVATNLKWILSSQSLCVMRRPRYETWMMEGLLQAGVHYIGLEDDYADFDEKIRFYENNPQAAERIVHNARQWMQQFTDPKLERLVGLMVMQKYFDLVRG